jgi:hypothetical protein
MHLLLIKDFPTVPRVWQEAHGLRDLNVTNKPNKQTTFRYTVCRSHEFEIDNQGMWAHMRDFVIARFLYFVKKHLEKIFG